MALKWSLTKKRKSTLQRTLQMSSDWSTICQRSHLHCLQTRLIRLMEGNDFSRKNKVRFGMDGSKKNRVSSMHCWTGGNDGVSVAGALWLSVIVSGPIRKQGWVTQAPNVNHRVQLGWLDSPGFRDQTIWPLSRAWTVNLKLSSDHSDIVASPIGVFSVKLYAATRHL